MMKKVVAVISHKPFEMPKDPMYCPIEVGAHFRNEHFFDTRDDSGENISYKNHNYCELTGIYYVYKNMDYDVLGLVHYRRHFANRNHFIKKNINNVLSSEKVDKILTKYDIILPKKRHYYIESNYSHYIHDHKKEAIDIMGEIIKAKYPDIYPNYLKHLKRTTGHYFNMFIAKKEIANKYLDFVFDVLSEVEKRIDIKTYEGKEKRVFGFLSELLIDPYVMTYHLKYKNQKYFFMEKQNWFKKIFNFIKRKFSH